MLVYDNDEIDYESLSLTTFLSMKIKYHSLLRTKLVESMHSRSSPILLLLSGIGSIELAFIECPKQTSILAIFHMDGSACLFINTPHIAY